MTTRSTITTSTEWTERWQGGFCPVGSLGGLPIRHAEFAGHPPLSELLVLPPMVVALSVDDVRARWAGALGRPVVLVRSVERARTLLLEAAGIAAGEPVGLPANATRGLVEAVKGHGAEPRFLSLDDSLDPVGGDGVVWAQPFAGLPAGRARWVDRADTLPLLAPATHAEIALWGLHLSPDPSDSGALLAFTSGELAANVESRLGRADQPDWLRAGAQLDRLADLSSRQHRALTECWRGLDDAAGLPMLPIATDALAHGVAVRVPDECDPATFYSYVRGENTPIRWLPEARPIHYAATRQLGPAWRATADNLSRWLLVPVGPAQTNDELAHAILGVVKASDYLGVRWRTDPSRATRYACEMDERYGQGHDAYRPAFPVP